MSISVLSVFSTSTPLTNVIILEVQPPLNLPSMRRIFLNKRQKASTVFIFLKNVAAESSPAFSLATANCVRYSRLRVSALSLHICLFQYASCILILIADILRLGVYVSFNLFWRTINSLTFLCSLFTYFFRLYQYSRNKQACL